MLMAIRNYTEADRYTVVADVNMAVGQVIKVVNNNGLRHAALLADTDAASIKVGMYGISFKVSADPYQVSRTTAPSFTGIRTVSILAGDNIVLVTDAFIEFDPSLLHSSLDPARGGALPAVGDTLAIKGSLLCTAATVGAITTPVIARVHEVAQGVITVYVFEQPV